MDEFQIFCSNDGAATTFSQILSECRKYGLWLTLAHQTQAQLGERIKGAISNIQLKVIFGVGRDDAEILTKDLFQVDPKRIKHRIQDTEQQVRSHPLFYSLPEQWEETVQRIQNLPARSALVRAKGLSVTQIRTHPVKYEEGVEAELIDLKTRLAKKAGVSYDELEQIFLSRYNQRVPEYRVEKPSTTSTTLTPPQSSGNSYWE